MFIQLIPARLRRLATILPLVILTLPARGFLPVPVNSPVPIDFSYAGYEAGARVIPSVKAVLMVRPSGGDDTALIQGALDRVAAMAVGPDGFRGALFLTSGRYKVTGQLRLRVSGVVLRGAGAGANGTVIVAEGIRRRTLIEVGEERDAALDSAIAVQDDVPAGGQNLHLASTAGLHVGDHVVVRRSEEHTSELQS